MIAAIVATNLLLGIVAILVLKPRKKPICDSCANLNSKDRGYIDRYNREELIELLCDGLEDCPRTNSVADHLIANGVTIGKDTNVPGKWIPVTERLPELDANVLMYFKDGKNMTVGCLLDTDEDRTFWMAYCDDTYYIDCDFQPTHWMPLPEPPKEGINDVY